MYQPTARNPLGTNKFSSIHWRDRVYKVQRRKKQNNYAFYISIPVEFGKELYGKQFQWRKRPHGVYELVPFPSTSGDLQHLSG